MKDDDIKRVIKEVSLSLQNNGYDPITQLVGYLISNDLGYIPDFDNNRNKMAILDRTHVLEGILREYLK